MLPTLVELASGDLNALQVDSDGKSLLESASGGAAPNRPILTEYAAEGSIDPMVMIRDGQWKYNYFRARGAR
jgi:choline-sulfatase